MLFLSERFTNGTDFSLESVDENDDSSSDELQDAESRFTAAGTYSSSSFVNSLSKCLRLRKALRANECTVLDAMGLVIDEGGLLRLAVNVVGFRTA